MASPEAVPPRRRSRAGRPPRISRQMIAEAAHDLGLDGLTLRGVAAHLGVSIAALYHHVSSKDDLMRLAAEYSAARVPLPEDRGQHWVVWLYEWATYNREAFLAQPGLLAQYVEGAIPAGSIVDNLEAILAVLVRQGFTPVEANEAYELITSCALGTVVGVLRQRALSPAGRPTADGFAHVLAERPAAELPHVRALVDGLVAAGGRVPFHVRIGTVLGGIAGRRGDDPADVDARLAEAVGQ